MLLDLLVNQLPTDIWHDPVFLTIFASIATILAGLIGAFVTYWVFLKQRSKKEISYQVISNAPIASVNKEFEQRVTIQLDGKPVKDVRQVVLKLQNTGNVAVKRDDYDEPIRLTFEGSYVIGSDILDTEPKELINSIENIAFITFAEPEKVTHTADAKLEKFLLNPKQSITLTFLLAGAYDELVVGGRIVDGEIVKENFKQSPNFSSDFIYIIIGIMLVIILVAILSSLLSSLFALIISSIVGLFMIIFGYILSIRSRK